MSKISPLGTITSFKNDSTAATTYNSNNTLLTNGFNNTLSLDGSVPNSMNSTLDMNSNHIINLPTPLNLSEPIRLADVGSIAGGTATYNIVSGGFINVKAPPFNATGNGTTDDTAAINSALAAAQLSNGAGQGNIVLFPPGVYKVSSTMTIPTGVSIQGYGSGAQYGFGAFPTSSPATTFHWAGATGPTAGPVFQTAEIWTGFMQDFLIDFQGQTCSGINYQACLGATTTRVRILNMGSAGTNATYGFKATKMLGGDNNFCAQSSWNQCSVWGTGGNALGFYNQGGTSLNIQNCQIAGGNGGSGIGLLIDNDSDTGWYIDNGITGDPAINITGAGYNHNFMDCFIGIWTTGSPSLKAGNNSDFNSFWRCDMGPAALGPNINNVSPGVVYTDDNHYTIFHNTQLGLFPPNLHVGENVYLVPLLANSANAKLPAAGGSGLLAISAKSASISSTALYLLGLGSGDTLISQTSTDWVAPTSTPTSGKASVHWDGSNYRVYNNLGAGCNFVAGSMRTL